MPRFVLNEAIETREPTIVVDPGLPLGRHRFQLEVRNDAGKLSRPDIAVVSVERAIIIPTIPGGPVVAPTRPPIGPILAPVVGPNALPLAAADSPDEPASSSPAPPSPKPGRRAPRPRRKE